MKNETPIINRFAINYKLLKYYNFFKTLRSIKPVIIIIINFLPINNYKYLKSCI